MPLTEVNTLNPITVKGLRLKYVSTTVVTVDAGTTRDSTNTNNIVIDATTTLNTAVVGYNGLDIGVLDNDLLYYVFVIGDSTKQNPSGVIASLADLSVVPSAQKPLFPEGYDVCFRVGAFLTDGSNHILPFVQRGEPAAPWMFYQTPLQILTNGSATTTTAMSLAGLIPPRATMVDVIGKIVPATAGNALSIGTPPAAFVSGVVASQVQQATGTAATNDSLTIQTNYLVSNGSDVANVYLRAYQDLLIA